MVLNVDLFREERGGNPELVRESEKKRYRDGTAVDRIVEQDRLWRKLRFQADQLNRAKRTVAKAVSERVKKNRQQTGTDESQAGTGDEIIDQVLASAFERLNILSEKQIIGPVPPLFESDQLVPLKIEQLKKVSTLLDKQREEVVENANQAERLRDTVLTEIGNLVHDKVPVSNDEALNRVERTHGVIEGRKPFSHIDLVEMIDGYDGKRGANVAGSRGFYLKGPLVFLQEALVDLALQLLDERGFTPYYTPLFMRKEVMSEVAQLSQFDEELYKVTGGTDEDRYLIATAEQPIAALHRDEALAKDALPLKYAGISTCFRREAGSTGRDTRGIFRVHQFEKVEQFCITAPTDSWQMLDEMVANTEAMYQHLGLGYRVVAIISGELNNAAAMKYDIEAWFPGSGAYRELASCSNCTDYQARSLRVRFGEVANADSNAPYVHMLNATMCAATRTMCAVLETHQTEAGILVPEALRPFMPKRYKELIPFVKPATNKQE